MPRALLSVSEKTGLVSFARALRERGWTILSTGGTARALREAGVAVAEVSEVTGHPEIMDGRVKTLHPAIHAALLGRAGHGGDASEMDRLGYQPIDLLAVNLYPFRETVGRAGVSVAEAIEQIDIGGPAMLRSAAKNHERVWVIVDPADYDRVISALDGGPAAEAGLRRELAARVFAHTAAYDAAIAAHLSGAEQGAAALGAEIVLPLERVQTLRYGENPDQEAAFYREGAGRGGLPALTQLHGKELSFNNLLDVDAAVLTVGAWAAEEAAAAVIIKHTTPCGLALGASPSEAYARALRTDPVSAFGSVVAFNREVTTEAAERLAQGFVEAIAAPGFEEGALEILRQKKNLRLLLLPAPPPPGELDYKRVQGGFLVQRRLDLSFAGTSWRTVTRREPTAAERSDLDFAWRAVAAVKSNAIVLARGRATLGIGAGQMSRVDAARLAVTKARDGGFELSGSVLASDAFFPFRDGVEAAAEAGARAIVQPGGSIRDEEVIAAADEHGIAMVFTGQRVFRH